MMDWARFLGSSAGTFDWYRFCDSCGRARIAGVREGRIFVAPGNEVDLLVFSTEVC